MTEVPEHLLKKAAEARARLSGEGGDAASDDAPAAEAALAASAPVPAAAAVPAEPEPEPEPIPDTPMVAAAKARKTIPVWVMPVLLFLPIWAIYYVGYLENPPTTGGFAFEGEEVYAGSCAGCHGGGGAGGSGRQLNGGEVLLTFPVYTAGDAYDGLAGHIAWVANGSAGTEAAEGTNLYGSADRPAGQRTVGSFGSSMGGFASSLSVEELAASVFHERSQFGGDQIDADGIAEELEVLEEFVHVAEEEGIDNLGGLTVAEIHELLQQARGAGGGSESASE